MNRILSAIALGVAIAAVNSPSAAFAAEPATVSKLSTVSAALSPGARAELSALSSSQRQRTLAILEDANFGDPSHAVALMNKYPELKVENLEGAQATRGVVQRTRYVEQAWSIIGINYASIRTTISFTSTEHQVDAILNCWNSSWNAAPSIRSINGNSYSQYNPSLGQATCKTNWVLNRLVGGSSSGTQGLKVDGYGVILQRWSF